MLGARGMFSALQETVGPAKGFTGPPPAMEAQLRRWGAQAEARCRTAVERGGGGGGVGVIPAGWEEAWGLDLRQHQGTPGYDRVAVGSPTTG